MPVKCYSRPRFVSTRRNSGTERSWDAFKENRRSVPTTFSRQARDATEHLGVRETNFKRWLNRGSVPDKRTKTN